MTDLSIIVPIYKEDPVLVTKLYKQLEATGAEVIFVDDGSTMPELDIPTLWYPDHVGYGYALKTGIKACTKDIILTMDGDHQHSVEDAIMLYKIFKLIGTHDMVVGTRWNLNESGIRWFGRKVLNFIASMIAGHYLVDLNSGMRIFKKESMYGYLPILCDVFSFTTSLTMSMVADGKTVAYVPINVKPRPSGKSHVKVVKHGIITLWYIIKIGCAMRTRGIRKWTRKLLGR